MKADCCLESGKTSSQSAENETKCLVCGNTVFRVCRITSELIMLTCENCGEPHMVGINSDENGSCLVFWSQETGIED
jgi:transcription elongation factor Elf1